MIAPWRFSKTFGDSVAKVGKQYYWCNQHQEDRGLYVTHHPLDHGKHPTQWQYTQRRNGTNSRPGTAAGGNNNRSNSNNSNLQLSQRMQSTLTSSGFTAEQAEELARTLGDENMPVNF